MYGNKLLWQHEIQVSQHYPDYTIFLIHTCIPPINAQALDEKTLTPIWQGRDSSQGITEIRYSPDNNTLAVATFDQVSVDASKLRKICLH